MKRKAIVLIWLIFLNLTNWAQIYCPSAGQPGSNAIHMDSSVIINWANSCIVSRGLQDISNQSLGLATVGDSSMAKGKAMTNGVVSLGDGGSAICGFEFPIRNGPGYDFAVFENGFDDYFLELALVEVSSDGINYFSFRAHSLSDTMLQKGTFDSTEATKINNLAGKFRGGYGTPFDLQELANSPNLDLNNIRFVKVIDVIGSLLPAFAKRDAFNNKINDPWPTPFPSSGFDLDAIAVIHENRATSLKEFNNESYLMVYPNPISVGMEIKLDKLPDLQQLSLIDQNGNVFLRSNESALWLTGIADGMYFLKIETLHGCYFRKICVYHEN